jgi:uncharacterized repeat protein (TIGR02543 family)
MTGRNFLGWFDNSGLTGTAVTLIPQGSTGDKNFYAKWDTIRFTITASAGANGSIIPAGVTTVDYGANQLYSFSPNSGYEVDELRVDGSVVSNPTGTYNFTNVTSNRTINVTFKELPPNQFYLTLQANPSNAGTVSGSGSFDSASVRQISATANAGWHFVNWTESGNEISTNSTTTITLDNNRTFVANFALNPIPRYDIILSVNPAGAGTVSGSGSFDSATVRQISAVANSGYIFRNWTENGNVISTNATYNFTLLGNRNFVANFEAIDEPIEEFTVELGGVNPAGAGTVEGFGKYTKNSTVSLEAFPSEGYKFVNWTSGSTVVSEDNPFTFTLTSDTVITANFSDTTSILENTLISSIRILPHPVHQDALIEINSLEPQSHTVVTILDLSGREVATVYSGMLDAGVNNFPLPNIILSNGSYILLVRNGNGQRTERFIIAR